MERTRQSSKHATSSGSSEAMITRSKGVWESSKKRMGNITAVTTANLFLRDPLPVDTELRAPDRAHCCEEQAHLTVGPRTHSLALATLERDWDGYVVRRFPQYGQNFSSIPASATGTFQSFWYSRKNRGPLLFTRMRRRNPPSLEVASFCNS